MIVVIALVGLLPGLLLLAVLLPFFLVTFKPDMDGQTPLQRIGIRAGWRRARWGRSHLYRSGPLGHTPHGTYQLPGLLAASQLSEAHDTYDRPFARALPPVGEPSDCRARDRARRRSAGRPVRRSINGLPTTDTGSRRSREEPGLFGLPSVRRDRAGSGHPATSRHRRAPRPARSAAWRSTTLNEIVSTYPAGAADLKARVALTFSMSGRRAAQERHRDWRDELATRLGGLTQRLHATGAGVAIPCRRSAAVRDRSLPPTTRGLPSCSRKRAPPASPPHLRWEDVGPAAAEARDQSYWHDGRRIRSPGR